MPNYVAMCTLTKYCSTITSNRIRYSTCVCTNVTSTKITNSIISTEYCNSISIIHCSDTSRICYWNTIFHPNESVWGRS